MPIKMVKCEPMTRKKILLSVALMVTSGLSKADMVKHEYNAAVITECNIPYKCGLQKDFYETGRIVIEASKGRCVEKVSELVSIKSINMNGFEIQVPEVQVSTKNINCDELATVGSKCNQIDENGTSIDNNELYCSPTGVWQDKINIDTVNFDITVKKGNAVIINTPLTVKNGRSATFLDTTEKTYIKKAEKLTNGKYLTIGLYSVGVTTAITTEIKDDGIIKADISIILMDIDGINEALIPDRIENGQNPTNETRINETLLIDEKEVVKSESGIYTVIIKAEKNKR